MKYKQNKEDIIKKYEMESIELPPGEELCKLIIYKYILKKNQKKKN